MFEIVNPEVWKFPQRETKVGVQIVAPDFTAILHKSGKAKVFCKSLEQPSERYKVIMFSKSI
jgi:hypothetical protein